jgi:ubiquinone/menaquinone biosynthesis C-methylase UbiE
VAHSESNAGWRAYWQENRLAACVPDNPASARAIETHWKSFFSGLDDAVEVLDIATGNGVLLLWAYEAARAQGRELSLTGVDLAEIDPARFLPEHREALASVHFIGNTPAESLPFGDNRFDVLVSQYGLEYADLDRALDEVARVLKPGGQLHWLAHDAHSVVVAQGRELLRQIDFLLAPGGPFVTMKAFAEAQPQGKKADRATRQLTEALISAQAYCQANPPAALLRDLCKGILDTANSIENYQPADVQRWLKENRRRLHEQRQRISDLQSAQLTGERLAQLEQSLHSACWTAVSIKPLAAGQAGESVGVMISAVRTTADPG